MSNFVITALLVNVLVVIGLIYGISKRREPAIHMKVMTTCFVVDLLNVILVDEITFLTSHPGSTPT